MNGAAFERTALFEHRFWLQILGDHARFIFHNLSPAETADIKRAQTFIVLFDELLTQARRAPSGGELAGLTRRAYQCAQEIRAFKLELLSRHLIGKIIIHLPPTFFNHMLNELDEYLKILDYLLNGQAPPVFNPVHHHLLWLSDAAGHAASIAANLDEVEEKLMAQSIIYFKDFKNFYLKAVEMTGYMRTKIEQFPALSCFNQEAEAEILSFSEYLQILLDYTLTKQVLGTLTPLVPDHMLREECYYLIKLSQSAPDVAVPKCDPGAPRVEA